MSEEQTAGATGKASVQFTLHVHLDDGTIKDIPCVGTLIPEPADTADEKKE